MVSSLTLTSLMRDHYLARDFANPARKEDNHVN